MPDTESNEQMNDAARQELEDREKVAEGKERDLGPEEQAHRRQAEEAAKGAGGGTTPIVENEPAPETETKPRGRAS